jgi:hypothetical protein
MPEMAKESLRQGASGIQTLYMTGTMKTDGKDMREREPMRRFAKGS